MAQRDYKALLGGLLTGFLTEEDPVKAMLEWLLGELMKIESEAKVGAGRGKHSGERKTYFSGYRVKRLDSRVGTLYLVVPKVRKGGYVPFFVIERKRSEAALISLIQEAFINGVSTRKIERLAKSLGIEGISASEVSEITKGLDGRVEEFRTRQLKAEYPFIWVDAIYEKVRAGGKVVSMAMMIAYGVDKDGQREILAVEPMWEETEDSLQFYFFPEIDKRRLSSTNGLERTNREIRRRSRVVGVFPSVESYLRLITSYLIEYSEDWANEYAYIRADKLGQLLESEQAQAAS